MLIRLFLIVNGHKIGFFLGIKNKDDLLLQNISVLTNHPLKQRLILIIKKK